MAKSKARSSRKPKKTPAMPQESRARQKQANDARVRQLAKSARLQTDLAKQSAAVAGLSLKEIPAEVKRGMEALHRTAVAAKHPPLKRLTRADPAATDPRVINPLGIGE